MRLTLAPLTNFDLGAVAAAAIAFVAYRARVLTSGGALWAFAIGTLTFGALGWSGAAILLTFFLTSVALSRLGRARKRALLAGVEKGGVRDGAQVFANGGVAAICAALTFHDPRYAIAFAGAFAAAAADTWGTELGALYGGTPRSIVTGRRVDTGLSGGVTWLGTAAEVGGAAVVAAVAFTFGLPFVAVLAGGVAGAFVDSLLGATVQAKRWCAQCGRACESDPHVCGASTELLRGAGWFGNDAVNLAATMVGAAVAFALAR
ncbi:MAG: DUF92 domain-containing protein [Candidatus Eremiobacteraeota bacterium]|nr:DUF92 domain-containing protein [Candidatus Eremiobacteraeota bacterium]